MSQRSQRGRSAAAPKKRSLGGFYLLIGVVAVLGFVGLGWALTQNNQTGQATVPTPAGPTPAPPSVPNGRTPEGFYYLGDANAPIVVTEYGDFQ